MSTALATSQQNSLATMSEADLIGVLQTSIYPGATIGSVKLVLGYCKAAGLDPLQKPVHIVPMFDKNSKSMRDVIMPGVGMYRTQAARSGQYAGVSEPEFGPDVVETFGEFRFTFPAWCKVTVKRLLGAHVVEFSAKEFWKENYATVGKDSAMPNAMWKKRPFGQIAKCAEAQALRKGFPEVGAAPTADEMEGKDFDPTTMTGDNTYEAKAAPAKTEQAAPAYYPDADFTANLPKWTKIMSGGTKTPEDIIAFVRTKGVLSESQIRSIKNAAPTVIEGEVMTEAEIKTARQREMSEAQQ